MTVNVTSILIGAVASAVLGELLHVAGPISRWIVRRASTYVPADHRADRQEEWLAELEYMSTRLQITRVIRAFGFWLAAVRIGWAARRQDAEIYRQFRFARFLAGFCAGATVSAGAMLLNGGPGPFPLLVITFHPEAVTLVRKWWAQWRQRPKAAEISVSVVWASRYLVSSRRRDAAVQIIAAVAMAVTAIFLTAAGCVDAVRDDRVIAAIACGLVGAFGMYWTGGALRTHLRNWKRLAALAR
jgi:hypothetical protein